MTSVKKMFAMGNQTYHMVISEANRRGISFQELLKAVIIPEWFKDNYGNDFVERVLRSADGGSRKSYPMKESFTSDLGVRKRIANYEL